MVLRAESWEPLHTAPSLNPTTNAPPPPPNHLPPPPLHTHTLCTHQRPTTTTTPRHTHTHTRTHIHTPPPPIPAPPRSMGEVSYAEEVLNRALYALEMAWHPRFDPGRGACRLASERHENRALFVALFRHAQVGGGAGEVGEQGGQDKSEGWGREGSVCLEQQWNNKHSLNKHQSSITSGVCASPQHPHPHLHPLLPPTHTHTHARARRL